jgi:hypothetical protein
MPCPPDTRDVRAELERLLHDDLQERRRAHVAVGPQHRDGLHLQLGLADACGHHRAAEFHRATLEHRARWREVIREAVVDHVTGTKARSEERPRHAPVIVATPLRVEDRARRHEDARELPRRGGVQAAEGRRVLLPREQLRLARHRQLRQRRARGDRARIDIGQDAREARRARLRMLDLRRQRRHQRALALLGIAGFEGVVVISHARLRGRAGILTNGNVNGAGRYGLERRSPCAA